MQFNFKKEIPLILITVIPAIFLWYVWNSLPPEVPLHWNISGEVDRYGSKNELIWLTTLVPIFLYVLFLLVPLIDPKKKIAAMGGKFYTIRFYLTLFLSVLFTFIIYSVKEQTLTNPNYLFIIIGVFYVVLGNYFKTIKPNYFIGIRTPWALENETIWKSTHRLAGKLWVAGGLLIIITCFLFKQHTALTLFNNYGHNYHNSRGAFLFAIQKNNYSINIAFNVHKFFCPRQSQPSTDPTSSVFI